MATEPTRWRSETSSPRCGTSRSARTRATDLASCTASSSGTAPGTSRRFARASICTTSSSTATGWRGSGTSSTRSTSPPCLDVHPGYVGTGVVRAGVNLKRSLPDDGRRRVHRRLRRRLARRRRRPGQGRLVAAPIDRPRGARVARGGDPVRRLRHRRLGRGRQSRDELRRPESADPLALPGDARESYWRVMSVERAGGRTTRRRSARSSPRSTHLHSPAVFTRRIAAHANRSARSRRSSPRTRCPRSGSRSSRSTTRTATAPTS